MENDQKTIHMNAKRKKSSTRNRESVNTSPVKQKRKLVQMSILKTKDELIAEDMTKRIEELSDACLDIFRQGWEYRYAKESKTLIFDMAQLEMKMHSDFEDFLHCITSRIQTKYTEELKRLKNKKEIKVF